jgi:hypothetical protein
MYVGIIDQDLIQSKIFSPNLETMQLSTYHKQKKDIVDLVIVSKNIEKYDKLYLVKNKNDKQYLSKVINDSRTECIGLGFTNGKYVPRLELEQLPPDKSIYNKFIKINYPKMSKENQLRVRNFQAQGHYRYIVNNEINLNTRPQERSITIYDTDPLNLPGMFEFCENYKKVKFKYPSYLNSLDKIAEYINSHWSRVENKVYYNGTIEEENDFKDFISKFSHNKTTPIFPIDLKNNELGLQKLFALWLNRILYCVTRDSKIQIEIINKSDSKLYNSLFLKLENWNNFRRFGQSFKEFANIRKQAESFDNLCKRDYNINRMVQIVPKTYKKECNWNYVN